MNCKWANVEIFRKHFHEKYPDSKIEILEFSGNKKIKIKNKYGICIGSKQSLLLYGNFSIRTAINKTEYFINQAKEIHGNKYDYKKVKYINSDNKVIITCNLHGDFLQDTTTHLDKSGCPKCKIDKISSLKIKPESLYIDQINKIHNFNYSIKKNSYIRDDVKIMHYCDREDYWFLSKPTHILQGHGCRKCSNKALVKRLKEMPFGWNYSKWKIAGENSKNFDSFKVYIIKCWNNEEKFYKIGKTFNCINKRFEYKGAMPYNWCIIKIFKGEAIEISELETRLKNLNKKHHYIPNIHFSGKYECFKTLENYENIFIEK